MDGESCLMPLEDWPCCTMMATVDESVERHETKKERRGHQWISDNVADNSCSA